MSEKDFESTVRTDGDEEVRTDKHPSYGMVQFVRTGGRGGTFFGSSLKDHHTTFTLRVCRGEREHSLKQDNYYGREQLMEVELTANQFTELITTMNMGSGVPCTIRRIHGQGRIPDPPDNTLETERIHASFAADMHILAANLRKWQKQAKEILEKKNLTRADREQIESILFQVDQHVRSNIPFVVDQFQRATDKITVAAKSEVEQFTLHAIITAGLQKIREDGSALALREAGAPAAYLEGDTTKSYENANADADEQ